MRMLSMLLAGVVLAGALGCGNDDPNKDLKPVDPKTPPLKRANENPRPGGAGTGEKPSPVIK